MDKTIKLIKEAQERLNVMLRDYEKVAGKAQEIVDILSKYSAGGASQQELLDTLSDQEKQIFKHIGEGSKPKEIADSLGIKYKTFHTHKENIKKKLNLESAWDLKKLAQRIISSSK